MPLNFTAIEQNVAADLKAVGSEATTVLKDFEAFFAHNGSSAGQQAVSTAVSAVGTALSTVDQQLLPIADDIVTYALAKVPGGAAAGPAAIALFNLVASQIAAKVEAASKAG